MAKSYYSQRSLFEPRRARPGTAGLNHNYFDEITTERQAYWLGMLATDGSVLGRIIRLGLKVSDREHVEAFHQDLGAQTKITVRPQQSGRVLRGRVLPDGAMAISCVNSSHMVASLANYGFHGASKTFSIAPWVAPNLKLQAAYWRGCLDGDGMIGIGNGNRKDFGEAVRWQIAFYGNLRMVLGLTKFIQANTEETPWGVDGVKPYRQGKIHAVRFSGSQRARQIAELLYGNATVALRRKRDLANEILRTVEPRRRVTKEELEADFFRLGSWSAVASEYEVTEHAVYQYRTRFDIPRREYRRWDEMTLDEAEALCEQHGSVEAAGKSVGASLLQMTGFLQRARREAGRPPKVERDWSGMALERMNELFSELGSWDAVAKSLGVTRFQAKSYVQVQRQKQPGFQAAVYHEWKMSGEEVENMFHELGSWKAVAERLGLKVDQVKNHVSRWRKATKKST